MRKIRGMGICFILILITLSMVIAVDINNIISDNQNLPTTCDGNVCQKNNNYDSSKPTNAGKVMGLENANEVILEKGDGAIIEKETREIDLLKAQKVTIKGLEYNLPEKAKVKFVKESGIEKVKIILPDGTVLEDPKTVDKELAKDAVFEIKAETGSIKLGKDSFDGTLSYETDKDGNLHKYVKDEKYNLGGLAVTQKKEEKTEVFSDGDLHPEAKEAYLSLGDKTLVIGKNNEGKGPEIKFEPGNRFLEKITSEQQVVMSAGRDADNKNNAGTGAIKITNRGENAPEVVTDKNFRIENGKIIVKTGKTARGTDGIFVDSLKTDNGKKSYSMEIADERWKYKDGGNGKLVIDGNNQAMDDRLDKEPILLSTDLSKGEYQGTTIRINLGTPIEKPRLINPAENNQGNLQLSFEAKASFRANEVINKFRGKNLEWDENLAKGSYEWSKYMAEKIGDLQHADIQRLNVGGENIAMFTSNDPLSPEAVGEYLANQWITSKKGHKENILSPWRITGIGVYVKRSSRYGYEYYATERFNR